MKITSIKPAMRRTFHGDTEKTNLYDEDTVKHLIHQTVLTFELQRDFEATGVVNAEGVHERVNRWFENRGI